METNPVFGFDMSLPIQENTIFSGKSYNEFTKKYSQNVIDVCSKLPEFSIILVPANTKLKIINSDFKLVDIEFDSEIEIYSLSYDYSSHVEFQVMISPFEMLSYISIINKLEKINDPDKLKCITLLNSWNYILIDMIIDKNFNFQLSIDNSFFYEYYNYEISKFINVNNNIKDLISFINLGKINNKHWYDDSSKYYIFDSSLFGRTQGSNIMEYDILHIVENHIVENHLYDISNFNCKNIISPMFEHGNEYLISEILDAFKLVVIDDKSVLSYNAQAMNSRRFQFKYTAASRLHNMYRIIGEDVTHQQFIQLFKHACMKELVTDISVKKYSDNISVETLVNSIWTENKLILNNCSTSKNVVETYQDFSKMALEYFNIDEVDDVNTAIDLSNDLIDQFPLHFIALSALYKLSYAALKGEVIKELATYGSSAAFRYLHIFCKSYLNVVDDDMLLALQNMIYDISDTIKDSQKRYDSFEFSEKLAKNNLDQLSKFMEEYFKMKNWDENFINATFDSLVKVDINFNQYTQINRKNIVAIFCNLKGYSGLEALYNDQNVRNDIQEYSDYSYEYSSNYSYINNYIINDEKPEYLSKIFTFDPEEEERR